MSDIKLFRTANNKVEELQGRSATIEKSLQTQIERHMEKFLGVRFLATEYSTGTSQTPNSWKMPSSCSWLATNPADYSQRDVLTGGA